MSITGTGGAQRGGAAVQLETPGAREERSVSGTLTHRHIGASGVGQHLPTSQAPRTESDAWVPDASTFHHCRDGERYTSSRLDTEARYLVKH